jgi:hypothetical protein
LAITATILAKYDLLDEKPATGPPAEGRHRRSAKSARPVTSLSLQ